MRKKLLATTLAGVMAASMSMTAFAATSGEAIPVPDGTDVYAGIVLNDPDAKIRVEVPTLFAFVVNGTVNADTNAVTSADGTILLPNVKVKVDDPTVNNGTYSIQTEQNAKLSFTNYSTAAGATDGERMGIPVEISGYVNEAGTLAERNNWQHVGAVMEGDTATFKQYNVSVDGVAFDTPHGADGFGMGTGITLAAPDLGTQNADGTYPNMDATTKLAVVGAEHPANFDVKVGGQRGQYKQVEESAKVGTIVWTISYASEDMKDVDTAPSNPPLAVGDVTP